MSRIFVISDTHFGHENIIQYCGRPFANAELMDECLIDYWNETVSDSDIVYHCGDVYFKNAMALRRLKGRKRLLLGNHDSGKDQALFPIFEKIMLWRTFPEFGAILSHMPLHESILGNRHGQEMRNVHGHIHDKPAPSPRHINVSVEQINYRPVELEAILNNQ